MTNPGKTLTVFAVLIIIILISSTSIGFFLYHQERNLRKSVQNDLQAITEIEAKLQSESKLLKRQLALLEDKNKEADEKINNLLDEMELNDSLRKELKKDNDSLKTQAEGYNQLKIKSKLESEDAAQKLQELQSLLEDLKQKNNTLTRQLTGLNSDQNILQDQKVELDKIVVNPDQSGVKGRIVSIDKDTEFVICNLGLKQGVKSGNILAVYRGEEYLGDVKVTRVQEQICAADFIPPFSVRRVRKNDIIMVKPQ